MHQNIAIAATPMVAIPNPSAMRNRVEITNLPMVFGLTVMISPIIRMKTTSLMTALK